VENPDGARFCVACGTSLVPACRQCGAELPEGARFCPACGTRVEAPEPTPQGQERRLVTVLFADLTGSTHLGERFDPEELRDVLDAYFAAMREEIEAMGGTVEKFIGDAVVAVFGVPAAHEDDPGRALRAALRMRTRLTELNRDLEARHGVSLEMRIGVNTGEVLAAVNPRPGEPMVTGDAVNVAARLEQTADPGEIVVAERTARAARTFRFRALGALDLRGKEHSVPAVVLLDERRDVPERGVPGLQAPMVGRERESDVLRSLYARVQQERRPHLVTVYGDPGVGKSRLVREFVTWTGSRTPGARLVTGRCLPYGDGVTYWPLAEILKEHAGVLDTDPAWRVLAKVSGACDTILAGDPAIRPDRACAALAYTIGVEDPDQPMPAEPRQVRVEMHAAWRGFFTSIARDTPVVAVIEDIHWADPALLDLLQDVTERVEGPLLFVCTARPELTDLRPTWGGGRRNASSLSLDPLTREDSDRLVSHLLAVDELPDTTRDQILLRAEGNPFFLEEIVRHLIDEGRIVQASGRWRAAESIGDVVIPDTVQGVLSARIDLLDASAKRTLQLAAVVGRVFWSAPVRMLLDGQRERLNETLDHLEERDLVRSRLGSSIAGEPEFAFKHILTREVAYESLPRRERGSAHAVVARWIRDTAGERADELVELLAYHHEEAYRAARDDPRADPVTVEELRRQAFATLLHAAEEARRRFAVDKGVRFAQQALQLSASPLDRIDALERIGIVAIDDYRGDLAWASLKEAVDLLLEHAPMARERIAFVCAYAVESPLRWPGSMSQPAEQDEVRRYLDIGFAHLDEEATEAGVRLLLARSFEPFGFGQQRDAGVESSLRASADGERAADLAMQLGRLDLASAALDGACSATITVGRYGGASPLMKRRLALVERLEDPWEVGDILAMEAWHRAMIGDLREAASAAEEGRRRTADQAEGLLLHSSSWLAFTDFLLGEWDGTIDLFRECETILRGRPDDPPYFTMQLHGSAAFVRSAREEPEAEGLLDLLVRLRGSRLGGSVVASTWVAWIRGERGETDHAWAILAEADEGPRWDVMRPLQDLVRAELLASSGRWAEVPAFLTDARAYADDAGLHLLPAYLDRLEGRAARAAGETTRGIHALQAARDRFADLGARFEVARTDLDLADMFVDQARDPEARDLLLGALEVFEALGSIREMARARALQDRLV
jgi:class 3 adenylate cyclase